MALTAINGLKVPQMEDFAHLFNDAENNDELFEEEAAEVEPKRDAYAGQLEKLLGAGVSPLLILTLLKHNAKLSDEQMKIIQIEDSDADKAQEGMIDAAARVGDMGKIIEMMASGKYKSPSAKDLPFETLAAYMDWLKSTNQAEGA